jgi:hypothetical protein
MEDLRDIRLTEYQLDIAHRAVEARRRELSRRLDRSSYDNKPGMKSAVVEELREQSELARILAHNRDALRRQKADRIKAKLGL